MSLEGVVCPAECAAGPVGWSLALLCPLTDGEMVLPAFPWSLEFRQHRQELGFIKSLLEMQINTVTNANAISCALASNSHRMSPCSSPPEGGRKNCLKTHVCVGTAILAPAPQGHWPQQQVHVWANAVRAMGQKNRFFYKFKFKV